MTCNELTPTSDDTCVAILEKHPPNAPAPLTVASAASACPSDAPARDQATAKLVFHKKITSDNSKHRGIHPIAALESHQASLAGLIQDALRHTKHRKPDFVSVTRGPGMRTNLSCGLDVAKGLALAWQVPLVAVHHMQAHALTPRLVSALEKPASTFPAPAFPFFSLLVSGGHTMLLHSKALTDHGILASTADVAIGDMIDKVARLIVPSEMLNAHATTAYGAVLEKFAFPDGGVDDYGYRAPRKRAEELAPSVMEWGWSLSPPLSTHKARTMQFSFSGLGSTVETYMREFGHELDDNPREEAQSLRKRRIFAREVMRIAFQHLASRVLLGLREAARSDTAASLPDTLVVSGGVAANNYLRTILRGYLDANGYSSVRLLFPPIALCTDNAAMIAWAGCEMYEAGWITALSCSAIKRWSMDPAAEDGGILGVSGWLRRS
ncbi:MAG: hypothetical protein M1825_000105 [Sarcosagium campestre]|nr:MAG: hypothetical protein M1825_000105 [Sarcosagium campestre]